MCILVMGTAKKYCIMFHLKLERGKTYAFVGPTGGGKTTTASLIARLYDPTTGNCFLDGKDIRTYTPEERHKKSALFCRNLFYLQDCKG